MNPLSHNTQLECNIETASMSEVTSKLLTDRINSEGVKFENIQYLLDNTQDGWRKVQLLVPKDEKDDRIDLLKHIIIPGAIKERQIPIESNPTWDIQIGTGETHIPLICTCSRLVDNDERRDSLLSIFKKKNKEIKLENKYLTWKEEIKKDIDLREIGVPVIVPGNQDKIISTFKDKYGFLSNFASAEVKYNGITFPSVEHAYQYAKFAYMEAETITIDLSKIAIDRTKNKLVEILKQKNYQVNLSDLFTDNTLLPGDTKILANALKEHIDKNRETKKLEIMIDLLLQKFLFHPDLKKKLIETNDQDLIEYNTWNDNYRGITNEGGKNMLGKILMRIREKISKENS